MLKQQLIISRLIFVISIKILFLTVILFSWSLALLHLIYVRTVTSKNILFHKKEIVILVCLFFFSNLCANFPKIFD